MPVVAQRQNPDIFAATAANIQLNRALYSVVVPAFGLVLLVLALKKGFSSGKHSRSAYASIASLAILSGLAGSLGSHAQAKVVIQALLSLFLCIPVLHLTSIHKTSARRLSHRQFIIRTLLKSLLFISLSSATLFALLNPFLTHKLPASVHLLFPATLFLAYTIFAICLLSQIFLEFCRNRNTLNGSRPRPITINIHVATRSAAVPINLARLSSFSAADCCEGVQETGNSPTELEELKHQKRPSVDSGISIISTFKPTNFVGSAHPSRSDSRRETDTLEFNPLSVLQFRTRIHDLLPLLFLFLAQLALCASYSCKLVIDYKPLSAHVLENIHTSLNFVSVMATMKAYLLHAYNTHLGSLGLSMPNSSSSSGYSNNPTANLVSAVEGKQATPFRHTVTPPVPPKSLASPSKRFPSRRLRVPPSLGPGFNRACSRPNSTISDHRSTLQMTDSEEKGRDGRLVNSFSVGSLKSTYGTSGSEESDQTRVEGSVESDTSKIVGKSVGDLEGTHAHITERRGNIPAPPENLVPKRSLGFGWLNGMANRYRESREQKDFINVGGERHSVKPSIPSSSVSISQAETRARGREPKKLKRNNTIASSLTSTTLGPPTSHPPSAFTYAYWNSDSTLCRASSSDLETDMNMGNIMPLTPVRSPTRKLAKKRGCEYDAQKCGTHEDPGKSRREGDEESKNGNSANSGTSSAGCLRLKRSFKLDDGRTLSPQLTLAAAIAGDVCTPPLMEGEFSSGSRWEREVKGMTMGRGMGSSQLNGTMRIVTAGIKTETYPGPEKSRERMNIKNSPNLNITHCPLDVSVGTGFIPTPIRESIPTTTPAFATERTTATAYPSESASCCSSATASPLVPDRTPMIFRSSVSDQGHGQRSLEPFPLARISSSPSSRTQPVLLRGTPVTPTRGQSTFSSSSSSSRLSAVTIESVRNAFSGIWSGKRGGKTGVTVPSTPSESISNGGSPEMSTFSGVAILDNDDDFTDLRDPFASPRAGKVRRIPSSGVASVDLSEDGYGEPSEDLFATTRSSRKGRRLPISPTYPLPGQSESNLLTSAESTTYSSRIGDVPPYSKEHRKERRTRKRMQRGAIIPMARLPVLADVDFDVEEALLTQRLLKRLDDDVHVSGVRL